MSKFFTILTAIGEAKLANATALGLAVHFEKLALGDGGGSLPTPDKNQVSLVNEVHRASLNSITTDPNNANWIICEQVIPESVGGWTIREVGIYDVDGDLIAIGNLPETYKPILEEGSGRTQTIRVVLQVSSSASVELKIDPSIVLATREYVDSKTQPATEERAGIAEIATQEETNSGKDDTKFVTAKKLLAAFLSRLSSAVDSTSETVAATPKAVKLAYDRASTAITDAGNAQTTADGKWTAVDASETVKGIAAIATVPEVLAGIDNAKMLSPVGAKAAYIQAASFVGLVGYFHKSAAISGWVDLKGGTLDRVIDKLLWDYANTTGLVIAQATKDSDPMKYAMYFGTGDGSTTFTLPHHHLGHFLRGNPSSVAHGETQGDAIRNITGYAYLESDAGTNGIVSMTSGAFYTDPIHAKLFNMVDRNTDGTRMKGFGIDASKQVPTSSENRPYAANLAAKIYRGFI